MSAPLILSQYKKIEGIHRVEVARLDEDNLVNLVLKYDPQGMFAPTTNVKIMYINGEIKICNLSINNGRNGKNIGYFVRRVLDVDTVLKDTEVLEYIVRISQTK